MNCSKCGKDMMDGNKTYAAAVSIKFLMLNEMSEEFLQRQLGPYEIKEYDICYECFLCALGIPEPDKVK